MSDEFDDLDENDDDSGSNLIKDLRRQLKAQKKANEDALAELSKFRSEQRKANVASLLEKAGADPRYAKFYNSEDSSEEAVSAWIQSEAELLGVSRREEAEDDTADAVRAINNSVGNAPQRKVGSAADALSRAQSAKTPEELRAAMQMAGITFE